MSTEQDTRPVKPVRHFLSPKNKPAPAPFQSSSEDPVDLNSNTPKSIYREKHQVPKQSTNPPRGLINNSEAALGGPPHNDHLTSAQKPLLLREKNGHRSSVTDDTMNDTLREHKPVSHGVRDHTMYGYDNGYDDFHDDESLSHHPHHSGMYNTYEAQMQATKSTHGQQTTKCPQEGHHHQHHHHRPGSHGQPDCTAGNHDHSYSDMPHETEHHHTRHVSRCTHLSHGQSYSPTEISDFPDIDADDLDMFVPPLDEIPNALLFTGDLDQKMMKRALAAQSQKQQLQYFNEVASTSSSKTFPATTVQKKINKNKNLMLSKKKDSKLKNELSKEGNEDLVISGKTDDTGNKVLEIRNAERVIGDQKQEKQIDSGEQAFDPPPKATQHLVMLPTVGQQDESKPKIQDSDQSVKELDNRDSNKSMPEPGFQHPRTELAEERLTVPTETKSNKENQSKAETETNPKRDELEIMRQKRLNKFQIEAKTATVHVEAQSKTMSSSSSKFVSKVEKSGKKESLTGAAVIKTGGKGTDRPVQLKDKIYQEKKTASEIQRNRNKEREKILTKAETLVGTKNGSDPKGTTDKAPNKAKDFPERFAAPIQYQDSDPESDTESKSAVKSDLDKSTTIIGIRMKQSDNVKGDDQSFKKNSKVATRKNNETIKRSSLRKKTIEVEYDKSDDEEELPVPYAMTLANKSSVRRRRKHDQLLQQTCLSIISILSGESPGSSEFLDDDDFGSDLSGPDFDLPSVSGKSVKKNKNKNVTKDVAKFKPKEEVGDTDLDQDETRQPSRLYMIYCEKLPLDDQPMQEQQQEGKKAIKESPPPKLTEESARNKKQPTSGHNPPLSEQNANEGMPPPTKPSAIAINKNTGASSAPTVAAVRDSKKSGEIVRYKPATSEGAKISTATEMNSKAIADRRHRAFRLIRHAHQEDHLKCSDCGRPECTSQNMQLKREMVQVARSENYDVWDVVPDGNCMFAAVVDQLQLYGDCRFGPQTLRESAVAWLIDHPCSNDGTHFSSFIEEDWQTYLSRMMSPGQWGDHIVLRAIVEVVSCMIKILHTGGTDTRWTTLEPASVHPDNKDKFLILGHVGEFHYTSLRPTDSATGSLTEAPHTPTSDGPTDDDRPMSLEGSENINIFREDFVDEWSDMPVAHLSYLLKTIIPKDVLNMAAIFQSQTCDMESTKERVARYGEEVNVTGHVANCTFVPYLHYKVSSQEVARANVDIVAEMPSIRIDSSSPGGPHSMSLAIDDSMTHPGYTRLLQKMDKGDGQSVTNFVSNASYASKSLSPSSDGTVIGSSNLVLIYSRMIPQIKCLQWPDAALSWKTRIRRESWPTNQMIESIVGDGCYLRKGAHETSQQPDIEWQFSFALAEKKLFNEALSPNQKYCYIAFETFLSQTEGLDKLTDEHFKSVFLYACERIPADFWSSSPGSCLLYLLDELLRYVKEGNLPDYFISSNNMIDHIPEARRKELAVQIEMLRVQPLLVLRQIDEAALLCPLGNSILNTVSDDMDHFKSHRSVKRSTLEVFIPATIRIACQYIRSKSYRKGYELLSQAFEERLGVSTCDESLPYNMFLVDALSNLDMTNTVWFAAYADRHLEGQMPTSLIQDLYGSYPLVAIKNILPEDLTGGYGNTKVPQQLTLNLFRFCNEFAKFLYIIEKISAALPVLKYCHEKYREHRASKQAGKLTTTPPDDDVDAADDELMLEVYAGISGVLKKQQKIQQLHEVLPDVKQIHSRMNNGLSGLVLILLYQHIGDSIEMDPSLKHMGRPDEATMLKFQNLVAWPYR